MLLDELPTIFIKGLDNLIATARSNKVAIVLGAQDKSQLVRDYNQKEADKNDTKIARKHFCGEIQIDMEKYRRKQASRKPLPMMTDFGDADIENNVRRLGEQVIRQDITRRIMDEEHRNGRFPTADEISPEVDSLFRAVTPEEAEKILKKVTERNSFTT